MARPAAISARSTLFCKSFEISLFEYRLGSPRPPKRSCEPALAWHRPRSHRAPLEGAGQCTMRIFCSFHNFTISQFHNTTTFFHTKKNSVFLLMVKSVSASFQSQFFLFLWQREHQEHPILKKSATPGDGRLQQPYGVLHCD